MKTINLRWMYPHYRHDEFVDVTDEVWAAMYQASGRWRTMSVGKSTTAPTTLWTHTAWKITHWNTADRRKIFCWNEKK